MRLGLLPSDVALPAVSGVWTQQRCAAELKSLGAQLESDVGETNCPLRLVLQVISLECVGGDYKARVLSWRRSEELESGLKRSEDRYRYLYKEKYKHICDIS